MSQGRARPREVGAAVITPRFCVGTSLGRYILGIVTRIRGRLSHQWSIRSALAGAITVCAIAAATATGFAEASDQTGDPRLPTAVNAPGTWSEEMYDSGRRSQRSA